MRFFLIDTIGTILKDTLTAKDGESYDIGKVIWAMGTMVYLAGAIVNMSKGIPFDYNEFGLGFGAVIAAGAAAIKIKETTEPTEKKNVQP